jgi:hypothetical protein
VAVSVPLALSLAVSVSNGVPLSVAVAVAVAAAGARDVAVAVPPIGSGAGRANSGVGRECVSPPAGDFGQFPRPLEEASSNGEIALSGDESQEWSQNGPGMVQEWSRTRRNQALLGRDRSMRTVTIGSRPSSPWLWLSLRLWLWIEASIGAGYWEAIGRGGRTAFLRPMILELMGSAAGGDFLRECLRWAFWEC